MGSLLCLAEEAAGNMFPYEQAGGVLHQGRSNVGEVLDIEILYTQAFAYFVRLEISWSFFSGYSGSQAAGHGVLRSHLDWFACRTLLSTRPHGLRRLLMGLGQSEGCSWGHFQRGAHFQTI